MAIIISILALMITILSYYSNNKQVKKTNIKAERAIKLSEGNIEMGIRNSISNARVNVNSTIRDLENFKIQNPNADLKTMTKLFN